MAEQPIPASLDQQVTDKALEILRKDLERLSKPVDPSDLQARVLDETRGFLDAEEARTSISASASASADAAAASAAAASSAGAAKAVPDPNKYHFDISTKIGKLIGRGVRWAVRGILGRNGNDPVGDAQTFAPQAEQPVDAKTLNELVSRRLTELVRSDPGLRDMYRAGELPAVRHFISANRPQPESSSIRNVSTATGPERPGRPIPFVGESRDVRRRDLAERTVAPQRPGMSPQSTDPERYWSDRIAREDARMRAEASGALGAGADSRRPSTSSSSSSSTSSADDRWWDQPDKPHRGNGEGSSLASPYSTPGSTPGAEPQSYLSDRGPSRDTDVAAQASARLRGYDPRIVSQLRTKPTQNTNPFLNNKQPGSAPRR
ncbi:hypothetical protein ABT336_17350 [Micromonospora sp. NPDC000207]|uniref:hypothetical protein n=1 Tax=Micromonospora sp. NPDC000207 TaxID=3154246 RepID=UPI0033323BCF